MKAPERFRLPVKAAVPLEVSVLPRPSFRPPPVMFKEATVLAKPEASSVPPPMVMAEDDESAGRAGHEHSGVDPRRAAVAVIAAGERQHPARCAGNQRQAAAVGTRQGTAETHAEAVGVDGDRAGAVDDFAGIVGGVTGRELQGAAPKVMLPPPARAAELPRLSTPALINVVPV